MPFNKILKKLLLVCCLYCSSVYGQNWLLTGNTGTDTAVNFIGTKDGKVLKIKVNNQLSGYLDYLSSPGNVSFGYQGLKSNTGTYNTALGYQALLSNTSGISNVALGYRTLNLNTTGVNNTAAGYRSLAVNNSSSNTGYGAFTLVNNTSGHDNTAAGYRAVYSNVSGSNNTAFGSKALYSNTTGYSNVAIGVASMYNSTVESNTVAIGDSALFNDVGAGTFNTAIGSKALYQNTSGIINVAVGYQALYGNKKSNYNTAVGYQAMRANTGEADYNTSIGYRALYSNVNGFSNTVSGAEAMHDNTEGNWNIASGTAALYSNKTGSHNSAIGANALYYSNGDFNVAIGSDALFKNTSGAYNVAVGIDALDKVFTGSGNTAIGYAANVNSGIIYNATAIGNTAYATAPNQVMLGNTAVTSVMAAGSYIIYSDGRFKRNIKANVPGLEFIKQLRPVTYNYNITGLNNYLGIGKTTQQENIKRNGLVPATSLVDENAIAQKEKKLYTGFVAQEVEEVANRLNYDFSGVYHPQNDKDAYGLSYGEFVVPLVKAVQQLSDEVDAKNAKIDSLEQRLARIESLLKVGNSNGVSLSDASLLQNSPNPFASATAIRYTLPANYANASIVITDASGKTLKNITLSGKGTGTLNLDASTMAAGAYRYTLYIDNKMVGSKQMVLTR